MTYLQLPFYYLYKYKNLEYDWRDMSDIDGFLIKEEKNRTTEMINDSRLFYIFMLIIALLLNIILFSQLNSYIDKETSLPLYVYGLIVISFGITGFTLLVRNDLNLKRKKGFNNSIVKNKIIERGSEIEEIVKEKLKITKFSNKELEKIFTFKKVPDGFEKMDELTKNKICKELIQINIKGELKNV